VTKLAPKADPLLTRHANYHQVTDILRCKWTVPILDAISQGVNRPGRLERGLPGLTTKVLNERLTKLVRHGMLVRRSFAEVPPRVEYAFTTRGRRLLVLIRAIREFVEEW
jgi:DNA-binding HxlR family transcriptional regulator